MTSASRTIISQIVDYLKKKSLNETKNAIRHLNNDDDDNNFVEIAKCKAATHRNIYVNV